MTDITDLVIHSLQQKPTEFEDTFGNLIRDRLVDAIDAKKIEVAKSLFNSSEEIDDDETFEDDSDNSEEETEDEQDA